MKFKNIIYLIGIILFLIPMMVSAGWFTSKVTGVRTAIVEKTSNYTITTNDYIVYVNASGIMNITLPNATSDTNVYIVKRIDSNTINGWVSVNTSFNQTVDGMQWVNLTNPLDTYTFKSNNSNWTIISKLVNVNYLPLTGGTMTGDIVASSSILKASHVWADRVYDSLGNAILIQFGSVGLTDRIIVNAVGVFFPVQVSTSRPSYSQGGIIYNTTTKGIEWAGDNNAWATTNHFRNLTGGNNKTAFVSGTIYQNQNSTPAIHVISFAQDGGACSELFYVDTANPPVRVFARMNTSTGAVATPPLIGVVPPYYYYVLKFTGSCPTISGWSMTQ